jgi:DNA-binding MarR family transcriptional regulator
LRRRSWQSSFPLSERHQFDAGQKVDRYPFAASGSVKFCWLDMARLLGYLVTLGSNLMVNRGYHMKQVPKQSDVGQLAAVEESRRRNMRQLLLRASRLVNRNVVDGLQARGYADLRSTHTTLLSNIDLAGSTVTDAAERAGVTKQAMGRLAAELESAGYIRVQGDPEDGRVRILQLTKTGKRLMLDSLEVMADLERSYARSVGEDRLEALLQGLAIFIDHAEGTKTGG